MVILSTPRVAPHVGLSLDHYVPDRDVPETKWSRVTYFWDAGNRLFERLKVNNLNCSCNCISMRLHDMWYVIALLLYWALLAHPYFSCGLLVCLFMLMLILMMLC